uniref:Uncharacterized protein n=1 Tax=Acrobeloides nanus TaxID=290746 RepID=A0A914D7W0_9BILA
MATFFKHVKINGMDSTVTFHSGPLIVMAKAAWTAKAQDNAQDEETKALRDEVEHLRSDATVENASMSVVL